MVDGLIIFQIAGVTVPTLAVLALFVRLGKMLDTVERMERDVVQLTDAVTSLTKAAISLEAWRDASKAQSDDVLTRVRRLEDKELARGG